MKKLYMHLLDGRPADWYEGSGQICFKSHRKPMKLHTMSQIISHQRITEKNRLSWGLLTDISRYSHISVIVP